MKDFTSNETLFLIMLGFAGGALAFGGHEWLSYIPTLGWVFAPVYMKKVSYE